MANQKIPGLSEKITAELKNRKITKKRLCKICQFSESTLQEIITTSKINVNYLAAIADALDVSVEYLIKKDAKPKERKECKLFKCPKSGERKCCCYCKEKESCQERCLNNHQHCGWFE